ncbi:unnamed protein product, partial [Hapterophycus canaliculatus]
ISAGRCSLFLSALVRCAPCCSRSRSTGTLVATGSSDSTVKVWDVERGYCTHNFRGHKGVVSVVAFHP